jgi:putative ABC transport system permease protein
VSTAFLDATGKQVGDTFTFTGDGRSATLTITGGVFDPGSSGVVLTNLSPVAALDPSGLSPQQYDMGLRPGVNAQGYANAVAAKLGQNYSAAVPDDPLLNPLSGLIAILTLPLAAVAGLGVLNTVVLMTRERVHDLGVFKAVGMTPRQTIAMVATTVAATGLIAGLIAGPAGIALQRAILPIMGNGAQTAIPAAIYNVYSPAGAGAAGAGRPGHRGCQRARPGRLGGADPHGARAARGVKGGLGDRVQVSRAPSC